MNEMEQYVAFIREAERLKSTPRTAWTADGRRESTAEHSWRLALFAGLVAADDPALDLGKVLLMCLVHDLGELYDGDISAALLPDETEKHRGELRSVERVLSLLPVGQQDRIMELWRAYNENDTPEAHLVKALDKAETILQHNQGMNPPGFDYAFNLGYGAEYFPREGPLKELRELLDAGTKLHL